MILSTRSESMSRCLMIFDRVSITTQSLSIASPEPAPSVSPTLITPASDVFLADSGENSRAKDEARASRDLQCMVCMVEGSRVEGLWVWGARVWTEVLASQGFSEVRASQGFCFHCSPPPWCDASPIFPVLCNAGGGGKAAAAARFVAWPCG
jgi:hypothetical protein